MSNNAQSSDAKKPDPERDALHAEVMALYRDVEELEPSESARNRIRARVQSLVATAVAWGEALSCRQIQELEAEIIERARKSDGLA
jgi:hypothetical protein